MGCILEYVVAGYLLVTSKNVKLHNCRKKCRRSQIEILSIFETYRILWKVVSLLVTVP